MAKTLMTVRWPRVIGAMAPIPILWLLMAASSATVALWLVLAILVVLASSVLAGTLQLRWDRTTHTMSDVIDDVDAEPPPITVRATSAVSRPRRARGRP